MNSKQILAIVSATAEPHSAMLNFEDAEQYESAVNMLDAAGCDVYRQTQNLHSGSGFEVAYIDPPDPDYPVLCSIRLISPVGYEPIKPGDKVTVTPEGKLALRVLDGGKVTLGGMASA